MSKRQWRGWLGAALAVTVVLVVLWASAGPTQPDVDPPGTAQTMPAATDDRTELLDTLSSLPEPPAERTPDYARDFFGEGWERGDDPCNTREEVLMRDLTAVTMRDDRACKVWTGRLVDGPYSGKTIDFNSIEDPQAIQIDHIVPLSLAWQMGAYRWTSAKREAFSNDQLNLIAVDGPENSAKSDLAPDEWMPKNTSFRCEYAARYVEVSAKYRLGVRETTRASLADTLKNCAGARDPG